LQFAPFLNYKERPLVYILPRCNAKVNAYCKFCRRKASIPKNKKEAITMPTDVISRADELLKLKELLDAGVLTQAEFDEQKRQLLSVPIPASTVPVAIVDPVQQPPVVQQPYTPPIIINNSSSSSASAAAAAVASPVRLRRKHSLIFDIFMLCITCGLWGIWMILRPKYY
jgi:hypothetical protein